MLAALLFFALPFFAVSLHPAPARASCESCGCVAAAHASIRAAIRQQHQLTQQYIAREFQIHRTTFILEWYFKEHILPAMMRMAEDLSASSMHQMLIIGTFFDAKDNMEALREMQMLTARAHRDYHPSQSLCEVGTMVRSLAPAQRNAEVNAFALSMRGELRHRNTEFSTTSLGKTSDLNSRHKQFAERHCDKADSNNGLAALCKVKDAEVTAPARDRNKDVDYSRVVDSPRNLMVDFATNTGFDVETSMQNEFEDSEKTEQDILALYANLYGHEPFGIVPPAFFDSPENQLAYLDVRAVMAKRSVAQNSFSALIGMKSKASKSNTTSGDPDNAAHTAQYMKMVYKQLGIDDVAEIDQLLGDRPSYFAQMEVLTKRLYQRPEFYTNLYDKPVNTDRKEVALRAIGLMQNMDMFKSQLRAEAALSVILETYIVEAQTELNNRLNRISDRGEVRTRP